MLALRIGSIASGFALLTTAASAIPVQTIDHEISQAAKIDTSDNDTWMPTGTNKDRIATSWAQAKSYQDLNNNSFRINVKIADERGRQMLGKIDVNCKNKDYYYRQDGVLFQGPNWAAIPKGSGNHGLALIFCKRTAARADWGYTDRSSYLWDHSAPSEEPENAKGEWIKGYDSDDSEGWFNTSATKTGNVVTYAAFSRTKKGDRSVAQPGDTAIYRFIRVSCTENLASDFYTADNTFSGEWMPPVPGRPGGISGEVRKKYCN